MAEKNLRKRVKIAEQTGIFDSPDMVEQPAIVQPPRKRASRTQSVHSRQNPVQPPKQRKVRTLSVDARPAASNNDNSLVVTACRLTNELIATKKQLSELHNKHIDLLELTYGKDRKIEKLTKDLEE